MGAHVEIISGLCLVRTDLIDRLSIERVMVKNEMAGEFDGVDGLFFLTEWSPLKLSGRSAEIQCQ
jgi:hypothetical protein